MSRVSTSLLVLVVFVLTFVIADDQAATTPVAASSHPEGSHEEHQDHGDFNFQDFFGDDNTEDDEHLQHHLKEDIGIEKSVGNMTEAEKDWYYFKLHDANADLNLDGLELLKAWQHHYLEHMGHEGMNHMENSTEEMQKYIDSQNESFIQMVDAILESQDTNNDGYLDYFEYMLAKQKNKEEEEEKKKKEEAAVKTK